MKIVRFYLNKLFNAGMLRTSLIAGFSFVFLVISGTVMAINSDTSEMPALINSASKHNLSNSRSGYDSIVMPLRHAQSDRDSSSFRSQSEVMREVKSRYKGRVVKMSLNERTATYSVRVLLPNGKIKNVSVSARK